MKLVRYGQAGQEKPGVFVDDGVRDLSSLIDDVDAQLLADGGLAKLSGDDMNALPLVGADERIGPCISGVGKLIAVGLNYSDHAAETGMATPTEPVLFMKATSSISGPTDPIVVPKGAQRVDWEVELGVVIGSAARNVDEARAMQHVAGYCLINDLSERAWQLEHEGQWVKGKSFDGFAPIGPWFVTRDEIPDPQALGIWLDVNDERMQDGSTSYMTFGVAALVSYVSRFMTLHPGDLISTGTPPGVGMGKSPPRFLRPGDAVKAGIQGLGEQSQSVVAEG